jgi:hypothetical protein
VALRHGFFGASDFFYLFSYAPLQKKDDEKTRRRSAPSFGFQTAALKPAWFHGRLAFRA